MNKLLCCSLVALANGVQTEFGLDYANLESKRGIVDTIAGILTPDESEAVNQQPKIYEVEREVSQQEKPKQQTQREKCDLLWTEIKTNKRRDLDEEVYQDLWALHKQYKQGDCDPEQV